MSSGSPISVLMFATIGITLIIAVLLLVRHRRKHGSHPMANQRERNIDEIQRGVPPER